MSLRGIDNFDMNPADIAKQCSRCDCTLLIAMKSSRNQRHSCVVVYTGFWLLVLCQCQRQRLLALALWLLLSNTHIHKTIECFRSQYYLCNHFSRKKILPSLLASYCRLSRNSYLYSWSKVWLVVCAWSAHTFDYQITHNQTQFLALMTLQETDHLEKVNQRGLLSPPNEGKRHQYNCKLCCVAFKLQKK